MSIVTDIRGFVGATAFVTSRARELGGIITEVIAHQPQRKMTLDHQLNLSTFRLKLANGYSFLIGGIWISDIDRAYDEAAIVEAV